MKKIGILLCLFSATDLVFSQGAFLEKNMSGFELGASASTQRDSSYLGQAQIGFSYFGIIDAGLSMGAGKTNQSKNGLAPGQHYFKFAPEFAVYALKQDAQIPLSFALNATYESDSYYSDYLSRNDMALQGEIFSFGAAVSRKFSLAEKIQLLAKVGVLYRMENDVLDNGYRDRDATPSYIDYPQGTGGCYVLFKQHNNDLLRIGAALAYDQSYNRNNVTVSVTLSVVMPLAEKIVARRQGYVLVPAERIPAYPRSAAVQPARSEPETIVINVPTSTGGFHSVKLVKTKDGYLGPQGEFYPGRPTITQLKVLYGD